MRLHIALRAARWLGDVGDLAADVIENRDIGYIVKCLLLLGICGLCIIVLAGLVALLSRIHPLVAVAGLGTIVAVMVGIAHTRS